MRSSSNDDDDDDPRASAGRRRKLPAASARRSVAVAARRGELYWPEELMFAIALARLSCLLVHGEGTARFTYIHGGGGDR